jgi:N-acetylglutamate synthase-like GNAT family acetyltransferase
MCILHCHGSTVRAAVCSTLTVEPKFIHQAGLCGHLEDIVVHGGLRGKGLGATLVRALTKIAEEQGCYKCILDCKEDNVGFYEKLGFRRKEAQCVAYFQHEQIEQHEQHQQHQQRPSCRDEHSAENLDDVHVGENEDGVEQRPFSPGRARGHSLHRRLRHLASEERDVGDGLVVRQLSETDYSNGFLQLLAQLTTVGQLDETFFKAGEVGMTSQDVLFDMQHMPWHAVACHCDVIVTSL